MSPTLGVPFAPISGFPRVSGDEPAPEPTSDGVYLFSPRERG